MEPKFWLERWEGNQIGFHQAEHNPHLVEYWQAIGLNLGAKVFVPLCGKSLDMRWLESQGHSVVGVELSQLAVEDYFEGAARSNTASTSSSSESVRSKKSP